MQCRIIDKNELKPLREKFPGKKIVFTNGCFDIIHVGHIRCLKEIRKLGDILVLGLNSDYSVKRLKGNARPVNSQDDRAEMLAQLGLIDYIVIFDEDTPEKMISLLKPDVWAKGGDYTPGNLPGKELADRLGIKLAFVPLVEGKSTTSILKKSGGLPEGKAVRIAVIGDSALDLAYCTHLSKEPSAETGLEVNYVDEVYSDAGGAANLACNLAILDGVDVDLYSFCGADCYAGLLKDSLGRCGVNYDGLVTCAQTSTYVYHRVFDDNMNELPRYDIGPGNVYSTADEKCLLNQIRGKLPEYDMIIINQQLSAGIYSEAFIKELTDLLRFVSVPVWLDCRQEPMFYGCCYKINLKEAERITGEKEPRQCACAIYEKFIPSGKDNCCVVITLGEEGALAYDGSSFYQVPGIQTDWVKDTVGAGDAFLAALCHQLAMKEPFAQALAFANAAGTASTKYLRRCGHPTRNEIEALINRSSAQ